MSRAAPSGCRLDRHWLAGVVHDGLVLVRGRREVVVELGGDEQARRRLLEALVAGRGLEAGAEGCELGPSDAAELVEALASTGALVEGEAGAPVGGEAADRDGLFLADAVAASARGEPPAGLVWTSDEMLYAPSPADRSTARAMLRFFVAGAAPHSRVRAYAHAATAGPGTIAGDRPDAAFVESGRALLAQVDPTLFHVLERADGSAAALVASTRGLPGAAAPHRLGPVVEVKPLTFRARARARAGAAGHLHAARYAPPNLAHPGRDPAHATGIAPTAEQAGMLARAEAAERFAMGDLRADRLKRARAADLDGAVAPTEFFAYNDRQLGGPRASEAYDPAAAYLWTRAETATGEPRWVPASAVFMPFADPAGPQLPRTTSSGAAVHIDPVEGRRRALLELVERDAFMWTWLGRVSRELIDLDTLPAPLAEWLATLAGAGLDPTLVNLTLDIRPVILCVIEGGRELAVGAAAADDPVDAARRAIEEASTVLWRDPAAPRRVPAPSDVAGALDHLEFQRSAEAERDRAFLTASHERVALETVPSGQGDLEDVLRAIGEPLFVDLTTAPIAPFRAVRALVPGLVPVSFGYDREPLGMSRLRFPVRELGGRVIRPVRHAGDDAPILPHPFP